MKLPVAITRSGNGRSQPSNLHSIWSSDMYIYIYRQNSAAVLLVFYTFKADHESLCLVSPAEATVFFTNCASKSKAFSGGLMHYTWRVLYITFLLAKLAPSLKMSKQCNPPPLHYVHPPHAHTTYAPDEPASLNASTRRQAGVVALHKHVTERQAGVQRLVAAVVVHQTVRRWRHVRRGSISD